MDRWKSRGDKNQRGEAKKWEDQRRERVRRKKMQVREKVGKSPFSFFVPMIFVALEGRKVGSLKRRVRSHLARWEMKNCMPLWSKCTNTSASEHLEVELSKKNCALLWREAHVQVKMYKTNQRRTTFGSWDIEIVHAVVALSTCPSKKCKEADGPGPHSEIGMSKMCMPLWREAHFQIKMVTSAHVRTTFGSWDVEKVHAVVVQSTFGSEKCQKLQVLNLFLTFGCRKSAH